MNDWNANVITEFRANGGRVAQFGSAPMVILHTIGARSGVVREIPLVALLDGEDLIVFASKGGSPTHPDWVFNLRANPRITIEFGAETFTADVVEMPENEGQAQLRRQAEIMPNFGSYVTAAAPRVIPAFRITRP